VLHLFNSFNPGGTEGQTMLLVKSLQETGRYDVQIACQSAVGPLRDGAKILGFGNIPSYPLSSFYNPATVVQVIRFATHLRRSNIDIIHTHDFYTNLFGLSAGTIAGVPVRIASRRELDVFTLMQRRVEHKAFQAAHSIVANCTFLHDQLIREGVRQELVTTIYNGVHPDRVKVDEKLSQEQIFALFGLPSKFRYVTMIANLHNVKKDHRTFLQAAKRVFVKFPDAAFVIAGAGEQKPLRSLVAELGIGERTFFIGRCDHVAELLAISLVGVLSSISEGLSNSVLEYMAAGLPVIASDVGGTREAVLDGETGFVVMPGDCEAIAGHIIELLRDPTRASEMGMRAQCRVADQFSPSKQLESTMILYDHLLKTRAGQSRYIPTLSI
jgi:glycosyltransferase involved in cell wall biosynthesis